MVDILNIIQKVHDTGIHQKVYKEQMEDLITRGSKRQTDGTGPFAHYLSGQQRTDAPRA